MISKTQVSRNKQVLKAIAVIVVLLIFGVWAYRPFWLRVNVQRNFVSTDGRLPQAIENGEPLEQIRRLHESDPTLFDKSISPFGNPFDVALRCKRLDVIEYFAKNGYDLNQQMYNSEYNGYTPLGYATEVLQSPKVVELLLELGADPDFAVNDGKNARELAEDNALLEIVIILNKAAAKSGH